MWEMSIIYKAWLDTDIFHPHRALQVEEPQEKSLEEPTQTHSFPFQELPFPDTIPVFHSQPQSSWQQQINVWWHPRRTSRGHHSWDSSPKGTPNLSLGWMKISEHPIFSHNPLKLDHQTSPHLLKGLLTWRLWNCANGAVMDEDSNDQLGSTGSTGGLFADHSHAWSHKCLVTCLKRELAFYILN